VWKVSGGEIAWAVLGTGAVAESVAQAIRGVGGQVAVVASRRRDRAEAFAARHGARAASYDEAATDPEVRAVYIATPPSEHEAQALRAIGAGKAVLIEKPFAINEAGAARIRDAAAASGVFCMEALWTRFQPLLGDIRRRIEAGEIGTPRQFHAAFSGAAVPDASQSLFDLTRSGGALMHRGVYGLSLARFLLGPVSEVSAVARIGETGVDEDCVVTLRHASGAISTVRASLSSNGPNDMAVQGSRGTIRADQPLYRPPGARLYRTTPRTGGTGGGGGRLRSDGRVHALWQRVGPVVKALRPGGERLSAPYAGDGYGHQIEAVHRALAAGERESAVMPLSESVEVMEMIDRARTSWGAA
jgi:predicted dehydrogenase